MSVRYDAIWSHNACWVGHHTDKREGRKKRTKRKIMYTIQKAGFVKPITVLWTELRIRPLPGDWNAKLIPGSPPCRNKENGT